MCSFFMQPQNDYNGQKAYWLYKDRECILDNSVEVLLDKLSE